MKNSGLFRLGLRHIEAGKGRSGSSAQRVCATFVSVLLPLASVPAHAEDFPWLDLHAEAFPWLDLIATEEAVGDVHIGMPLTQASSVVVEPFLDATWFYGDNDCASFAFGEGTYGEDWHIRFLSIE